MVNTIRMTIRKTDEANVRLSGFWAQRLVDLGYARSIELTDTYEVIEFRAPTGVDREAWARQEAERLASYGINASAQPEFKG